MNPMLWPEFLRGFLAGAAMVGGLLTVWATRPTLDEMRTMRAQVRACHRPHVPPRNVRNIEPWVRPPYDWRDDPEFTDDAA